jgi:hypothetical protein
MTAVLRDVDPYDLEADAKYYIAIKEGTTVAAMVMAPGPPFKTAMRRAER